MNKFNKRWNQQKYIHTRGTLTASPVLIKGNDHITKVMNTYSHMHKNSAKVLNYCGVTLEAWCEKFISEGFAFDVRNAQNCRENLRGNPIF